MKKMLTSKTTEFFPNSGFDVKFLNSPYDLWLIFFRLSSASRYSETIPENTMQKTMAEAD